tara:strand:+ start:13522 stop:14709 length:1188 start_codon:yes stop_codon:yes gene_type:complete
MNQLALFNRTNSLFEEDLKILDEELNSVIENSKFLIVGGAGSIGQAVSTEIFKRNPKLLYVIDISENNLVELVRSLRSSYSNQKTDFKTFAIDCGSQEFEVFMSQNLKFDYVLNLSALKHVRSEKDPYTLMRLIRVNIFNTLHVLKLTKHSKLKNFFTVSTDKAANPVNLMGASKKIMEKFLFRESKSQNIALARFANVAFSDGSLLHGFNQRISKKQPLSAPSDIERYFITSKESGELCLLSSLLGDNRDIFFPKLSENFKLLKFSEIAKNYLINLGYEPYLCESEDHAKELSQSLIGKGKWPCHFFESDTTGEKPFEEFYSEEETLDLNKFKEIGIIKNNLNFDHDLLNSFENKILKFLDAKKWNKKEIVEVFEEVLPDFRHIEKNKNLDQKM